MITHMSDSPEWNSRIDNLSKMLGYLDFAYESVYVGNRMVKFSINGTFADDIRDFPITPSEQILERFESVLSNRCRCRFVYSQSKTKIPKLNNILARFHGLQIKPSPPLP